MDTELLKGSRPGDLSRAGQLLAQGQVVAIPTETVYGLAANALDAGAVKRIFDAKGRPQDNPLIVHISCMEQLPPLVREIPPLVYTMAQHFWPGPLTMVMKKADCIPLTTSAGLSTVGIRMPSHPLARAIIDAAGVPLAAPSANTSGKPSPTNARDVLDDMAGKIAAIVDGGACSVGVESTVVDMTGPYPQILRPGAITEEMIAEAVGQASTDQAVYHGLSGDERPKAPGMKYRHYAPKAPVLLFEGAPESTAQALLAQLGQPGDGVLCFEEYLPQVKQRLSRRVYSLGYSWDYAEHSRRLFTLLRHFDHTKTRRILAQCPRSYGANAGAVNRIRKSAGFQSADCRDGRLVVGVTGRTGSGKSLFSAAMAEKGALVLDADVTYKALLQKDAELQEAIAQRFPDAVVNGKIDRPSLGRIVFADENARQELNHIAHPYVFRTFDACIRQAEQRLVVLDVPLLFESGIDRLCDLTTGILCDREASLRRVMVRDNLSEGAALARLSSQPEDEFYRARCDVLLHNAGGQDGFEAQIEAFYQKYLEK